MNTSPEQNSNDFTDMKRHRLPNPSPELKRRVLSAARVAWAESAQTPDEVPWFFPVLRLAACVAVAVGAVYFANTTSRYSTEQWMAIEQTPDPSPVYALQSPLAAIARALPPKNPAQKLIEHERRIEAMLGMNGT